MSQGNGSRFGFKLVGALVLVGIAGLIVVLMITGEFFAWGITGASIILLAVMLAIRPSASTAVRRHKMGGAPPALSARPPPVRVEA